MRTKNRRGGRRKRPKLSSDISYPSSMASPSSPNRDVRNAEDNTLNETSRKETNDVLDDIDCFRNDTCVRCDESGELLVCCVSSCPIAIHEYCLSCRPTFDEEGQFYCPYCSYKRALVLVNKLRRKTRVEKRVLSDFIDSRVVSGDNPPKVEEAAKKFASDVSIGKVDANPSNHGSNLRNESLQDTVVEGEQNQVMEGGREKTSGGGQATLVVNGESPINPLTHPSNHGSNLHNESLRDPVVEGERNQIMEGDLERTPGGGQERVVVNCGSPDSPLTLLSNVCSNARRQLRKATPEVQPLEHSLNDEEICEADASRMHHCERQDGKIAEEENFRSMDQIQDEGIVRGQGQPETSSACYAEEETDVDDIDHSSGDGIDHSSGEQENIKFSKETLEKRDGGERIKLDEERMLETKNIRSGSKDLGNEAFVKKRRFKSRAGRRLYLENILSPRKSPRSRNPEPGKNRATKTEKVSASKNLKRKKESPKQFKNLIIQNGRRKRVQWSTEEEEMLKEGVHKFSSTVNKNLPWRKVLEFGRHIFDGTRTPADLKDKWRNIVAKDS